MKHLRSHLFIAFAIILTATTLTACGQKSSSATTASQPVTITFWHGMTGAHKTALNTIIRNFNRSQDQYHVVGEGQGNFANLQQKITAAAKSKTLPTIAQTAYTNVPDYVKGGFITSFDPYVSKSDLRHVYPIFLKATTYQHKTYALPFSKSAHVLFYNRDLLKKYHLALPKSWHDVQQDGLKLKSKGITAIAFDQSLATDIDALSWQAGTPLVSDQLKVNANHPKTVAATKMIAAMLKNKTATTAGTDGYGSTQFLAGKTLFYSGSSAATAIMQASTPKSMHWGTTVMPSYQGQRVVSIAGNDIVMFKSASTVQRCGAAAFMKFLLSDKQTIYWAKQTGYVPLTKTAQHRASYRRYLAKHPNAKAAVNSIQYGYQDPAFLGYNQYFTALNKASDQLVTKQATPKEALTTLQQTTEQVLK